MKSWKRTRLIGDLGVDHTRYGRTGQGSMESHSYACRGELAVESSEQNWRNLVAISKLPERGTSVETVVRRGYDDEGTASFLPLREG